MRPLDDANDTFLFNGLCTDRKKRSWQASLVMDHIKKQKGLYRCRLRMMENYKRLSLRYTNGALWRSLALIRRIVSEVLPVVNVFCGVGSQILRTRVPVRFHAEFHSYFHLIFLSCRICLIHTERVTVLMTFRKRPFK
jgi:hypothetical protein